MMRPALVLLALVPVLLGCGSDTAAPRTGGDPTPDDAGSGAVSGDYVVEGLPAPFAEGDLLRVTFGDGALSFQATCNTFSGTAAWEAGGVLRVSGLGGTEMGCPGAGHEQDQWLVDFFTAAPEVSVDGTDVRVATADTEIWLVPADEVAPGPGADADLVGTRWQLRGIEETDVDAVSMMMVTRTRRPVLLTVGKESIGFDTTCNTGGGDVRVVGDRLRLRNVVTTLRACLDERGEIEQGVMSVLGEQWVDWEIAGRELRLTVGDTALVYRAG